MGRKIKLAEGWRRALQAEFEAEYMQQLSAFLRAEKAAGKKIYPSGDNMFAALNATPLQQVKVVILGQDPYHGPNQAHGLSFSVPRGTRIPPSLQNIYKEQHADLGLAKPSHGHLLSWATQGVLLLNSVLTVESGKAGSHQGKGWERFTDSIIEIINTQQQACVFMLWGAYAQKKGAAIDQDRHLVLTTSHPSPLSAHRGFIGCQHFSRANTYLLENSKAAIDWRVRD